MRIAITTRLASLLAGLALAGCALPRQGGDPLQQAETVGFHQHVVQANGFALTTLMRGHDPTAPLRVYIEGDGRAWLDRYTVSDDPTPHHPLALQLALADASPNVAWLARPCQFSGAQSPACRPAYWTDRRFAPEVIEAMATALGDVAGTAGQPLELVGYSGGAAIAVALAAQRKDVALLVTVAGNLDSEAINRFHGVDPMPASLNPATLAPRLSALPQLHLVGGKDRVIPAAVAPAFVAAGAMRCAVVRAVPEASHDAGWADYWRKAGSHARAPACQK